MRPVVVAVAITGSVPRKKDNPALPTTPAEQIESTHQAYRGRRHDRAYSCAQPRRKLLRPILNCSLGCRKD